jgi:hypothetical protein
MEENKQIEERSVSESTKTLDTQSSSITSLVKSLIKFQSEVTDIKKDKTNPFFNSQYVDINTVLTHSRPLLSKNDLGISQGNRYCTASNGFYVSTTLFHSSGEWIKSEVRMPIGGKKDAQAVGASITYGRRYGLLGLLGISVEGDDDDGNKTVKQ